MSVSREITSYKEWSEREVLERGAEEIGVRLDQDVIDNLMKYLFELQRWNQKINLIGPGDTKEQIIIHLVDGLCLLAHMDARTVHFADVGSGGGIPGIILKIARPEWHGLLIEARSKRAVFLRHIIRLFKLDGLKVHEGRLDPGAGGRLGKTFDLVTMRGFASLEDCLTLARPLMAPRGRVAAFKGPNYQDEIKRARDLIAEYTLDLENAAEYELPYVARKRSLLLFRIK